MVPESIEISSHLTPEVKAKIRALAESTSLSDQGLALVSLAPEMASEGLASEGSASEELASEASTTAGQFLVATDDEGLVRAAAVVDMRLSPPVAEFIADPDLPHPTDWVQLLFDELMQNPPAESVAIWDHGSTTPTGQFAQAQGWPISRALLILGAPLESGQELPALDPGWQLRAFDPQTDESGWLQLNRAAFVDLPDQAAWTLADLRARYQEPWFNPDGFLVLTDPSSTIRGAHWTKQEGEVGEVYVLAVDPKLEGQGFGALLTIAGLNQLAHDGAIRVHLYVDSANTKAVGLYRKLGLTEIARDTQYLAGLGHA